MGKRGPKPLPEAMKELRGSRRVNASAPRPELDGSEPTCPEWIEDDAKAVWREVVPQLKEMGVLARIDAAALERYCVLLVRWRRAEQFIAKNGSVYPLRDDKGNVKTFMPFPQVSIARSLAQLLTRIEAEFGMTPSGRSGISVQPKPEKDEGNWLRLAIGA